MLRNAAGFLLLLAAATAGSGSTPRAELKLHGIFGDGMVLQRELPCPVWGSAGPGDEITVSLAGQTRKTRTGADGRWSLKLDPLKAGGPHQLTVTGSRKLLLRDVLIGEVWLAAGASNMELPLKAALTAKTEPDDGPVALLRFLVVPRRASDLPEKDVQAAWRSSRSESVSEVSATAYYYARELQRRIQVPVGIVQASCDDSPTDQWIGKHSLQSGGGLRRATVLHSMQQANYEIVQALYLASLRKAEEARRKGEPVPSVLPKPPRPDGTSALYNGMIAPLVPFALRGAVYYQGEAESWNASAYQLLFPGLIQAWRKDWGLGDFPFGFVQLANVGPRRDDPEESSLARFREAQARTLSSVPNTGMAVAIDIGEATDLRPRNKEEVGRRLALWAHARVYGKSELVFSGPTYDSMKVEGNKVRILFKNTAGGLKMSGDRLGGFMIAGDFRKFTRAHAMLEGETAVVWSDEITWPAAVRYGWEDNPECSLVNREGLPAAPFRTDKW